MALLIWNWNKTTVPKPPSFPALVQQFFTEYLVAQRAVSARTVACYRDALMLFLDFASHKLGKTPTSLQLIDMRPELILRSWITWSRSGITGFAAAT